MHKISLRITTTCIIQLGIIKKEKEGAINSFPGAMSLSKDS